jgi:SAM-dependent methyltransferase
MSRPTTIRRARVWRSVTASLNQRFGPTGRLGAEEDEKEKYGLELDSGDRHYRTWVGFPDEYDLIAALQVSLMLAAGLRETHRLADVGCGSLRAGRMLILYLRPGNYHGIEPEQWLVQEGIDKELGRTILEVKRPKFRFVSDFSLEEFGTEFDFVVAQSVFSHTYPDLLRLGLTKIAAALAPGGNLFATWVEGRSEKQGSGWIRKGVRQYTWEEMEGFIRECGLVARRLDWPHPRQCWFVAARPKDEAEIETLSKKLRTPREGWGAKRSRAREQKKRRKLNRNRA